MSQAQFSFPPIVGGMLGGLVQCCENLHKSIINVDYAGFSPGYTEAYISFEIVDGYGFKPGKFMGALRGDCAIYCLGHTVEGDKAIAVKVLVSGHAWPDPRLGVKPLYGDPMF